MHLLVGLVLQTFIPSVVNTGTGKDNINLMETYGVVKSFPAIESDRKLVSKKYKENKTDKQQNKNKNP